MTMMPGSGERRQGSPKNPPMAGPAAQRDLEPLLETLVQSLLERDLIGIVLLDQDGRVIGRHGSLVDWVVPGQDAFDSLPFLVGYDDLLAFGDQDATESFHLPRVTITGSDKRENGVFSVRILPWPQADTVALLLQDERKVAELERQRLQQRNELALAQAGLERAKAEAEAASRAKSAFLANVSHDLRTPLHIILGNAEILRARKPSELPMADYQAYLDDIHKSGMFLSELINDLLDLSMAEAGRLDLVEEPFDVAELLTETLDLAAAIPQAQGKVLALELRTPIPELFADRRRIKQAILNLLANALKFTPVGGRISLEAARAREGGLQIRVSDTGVGIPEEEIETLTQAFVQGTGGEQHGDGVGLGLHLVQTYVALHQGRLSIDSRLDRGTTVTLHLPAKRLGTAS